MSAFSAARAAERKPPRVVVFPPTIFADEWAARPTDDVAIGLRVPGDHAVSLARANAASTAWELHPREADLDGRIDAMNDALMRELCAAGMCSANNVFEPYFPTPEDDVRTKLTSEGVKAVFHALERLVFETSPVHREADDEEMAAVAEALAAPEILDALPAYKVKRARRLVAFLFDELAGVGG